LNKSAIKNLEFPFPSFIIRVGKISEVTK